MSCSASSCAGERVQLDAAGAGVALELGQQRAQRVAAVQLVRAVGGDDEHALAAQRAGEVDEEGARRAVGPVQVLDREQQPVLARQQLEQLEQARRTGAPAPVASSSACASRARGPGRICASALAGGWRERVEAPGRRRGPAAAARRRSARRAARPPPARRSRRRSRARRRRAPRARARTAAASCRRPTRRPRTPATGGRRPPRPARRAAPRAPRRVRRSACWSPGRPSLQYRAAAAGTRGAMSGGGGEGGGHAAMLASARLPHRADGAGRARRRCLTRARATPYGGGHADQLPTAPGARRSTATPWRATAAGRYSLVTADGGAVYWSEARPLEGGRDALVVRRAGGAPADVIPAGCSARTRVHEYGGGALHRRTAGPSSSATTPTSASTASTRGGEPRPITPEPDDAVRAALRRPAGDAGRTGSSACASATASPSTSTSSSRCPPTARRSRT